jgi:hypothetical protein
MKWARYSKKPIAGELDELPLLNGTLCLIAGRGPVGVTDAAHSLSMTIQGRMQTPKPPEKHHKPKRVCRLLTREEFAAKQKGERHES